MGKETALPKNIRQIGDIKGKEKICIEDYVMTYIHKKESQEETGFLGIFLGERQETEETDYTFIRGILEIPQEEEAEKLREQLERERSGYFPGWEVMGCCVIGVYPTKRLELLASASPEAERMIYHLQEQEENIYLKDQGNYRKLKGYLVFYEQNQKMQDYLAEIFGKDSVEKEAPPDKAIKSFRQKVKEKSEQKSHSLLKLASSFFVITVLAVGAIVVNRIDEIRSVTSNGARNNAALEGTASNTVAQYTAQNATSAAGAAQNTLTAGADSTQNTLTAGAEASQNGLSAGGDVTQNATSAAGAAAQNLISAEGSAIQNTAGSGEATSLSAAASGGTTSQSVAASGGTTSQSTTASGETASQAMTESEASGSEPAAQSAGTDDADSSWLTGSDSFWNDAADDETMEGETGDAGTSADGGENTSAGDAGTPETSEAVSRQTQAAYVIKAGDTLANICKRYYGSMERLEEICEANNITDANMILPGQKIVLP